MELRKEYAEIVEREKIRWNRDQPGLVDAFLNIALACQELADRPPRELTDAEIDKVFRETINSIPGAQSTKFARALEAAIHAKQREPETVKFRAARHKKYGEIQMVNARSEINDMWEWLDADGKPQEFEVKV